MASPDPRSHTLIILYASALLELQARIDDDGFITAPYSAALNRAFSVAAALNVTQKNKPMANRLTGAIAGGANAFLCVGS